MIQTDWLEKWARYEPEKIALKEYESGRAFTYRQLHNLANHLVNYFRQQLNLQKGDRIAVLAENSLEHFLLFFAAQKAGYILVPLNYRLAPREVDELLKDCQPSLWVTGNSFAHYQTDCPHARNIPHHLLLDELRGLLIDKNDVPVQLNRKERVEMNHPLFILYTSGTTGVARGALYTHKMLFWNSINTQMRLDITSQDRSISCTPLFHTGGWNVVPTPFLHHGAYVCLTRKFDPDMILQLLEEEGATVFMAVPTMLQMMAESPRFRQVQLKSMRFFVVGGEPMPIPLIEKWHAKGVPIRQGYGLTEVGPSVTSLHQKDAIRKKGSIGLPNFYIDTRIVDDQGNDVPPGEVGELLLRGPSVTPGYWNNPDETRAVLKSGWFYTGDLVRQDQEGYLYVVDRKKYMYISGGENVYPAEIEKFLYTHPAVQEVAVVGVPHPRWGEVGKAYIVVKQGKHLNAEQVLAFCEGKLARYKIPKFIEFVESLPKSDTGKIDRKALRNKALNHS